MNRALNRDDRDVAAITSVVPRCMIVDLCVHSNKIVRKKRFRSNVRVNDALSALQTLLMKIVQ